MVVGLVDYNVGNLQSVINAFRKIGANIELVSEPNKLKTYDKAILPGVGAFGDAMKNLKHTHMQEAILEFAKSGKYLFGVCLGMQLLLEKSYEFGEYEGLGLIEGEVKKFNPEKFSEPLKVPHMGWNSLHVEKDIPLFKGLKEEFYLYFVHSYHACCKDEVSIGKTTYGYNFASAIQKENIIGFQPHPEKSHENGLKILENFLKV